MNGSELGNLIYTARVERKISQKQLCKGVCSRVALVRLERGERMPECAVAECLLGRLGVDEGYVEFLYNESDYEERIKKEAMYRLAEQQHYAEALRAIEQYYDKMETKLSRQFLLKMQAVIEWQQGMGEKAKEHITGALSMTVPELDAKQIVKMSLSEDEIEIFLFWLVICGKDKEEHLESRRVFDYLKNSITSEYSLAEAYAKAVWLFLSYSYEKYSTEEILDLCLETERLMIRGNMLMYLPYYLEEIIRCYYKLGDKDKCREWEEMRNALKKVFKEYKFKYDDKHFPVWNRRVRANIFLMSENMAQVRKANGETQQSLAEYTNIDVKTVSRLENGRFKPKRGTYERIKEYLSIERDVYNTSVVTDDYEILLLEDEVADRLSENDYDSAEEAYKKIKDRLSDSYAENRQYIMCLETIFAKRRGEISPENALLNYMEAFRCTRKKLTLEKLDSVTLSYMETVIVTHMARINYENGNILNAIHILKKAMKGFENSKIDDMYHNRSILLLYDYLSCYCEEADMLEEAMSYCEKGIAFLLKCGQIEFVGKFYLQKTYIYEKQGASIQLCKDGYKCAYQLHKLNGRINSMKLTAEHYQKVFNETIISYS